MVEKEWQLPDWAGVELDCQELKVLDWFLSGHYLCNVSRGSDISDIVERWNDFRMDVWKGIRSLEKMASVRKTYKLEMNDGTAKYLFNWLPTTFAWGTGRDCGFSLKTKLHRFLAKEVDEEKDDDKDKASSDT